jgi:hypothetical protein
MAEAPRTKASIRRLRNQPVEQPDPAADLSGLGWGEDSHGVSLLTLELESVGGGLTAIACERIGHESLLK